MSGKRREDVKKLSVFPAVGRKWNRWEKPHRRPEGWEEGCGGGARRYRPGCFHPRATQKALGQAVVLLPLH